MITDAEMLKLVMDRYPEQNMQFILEQFTALKAGIMQANNKLAGLDYAVAAESVEIQPVEAEAVISEEPPADPEIVKKKYSKRDLKVKPSESIGDSAIKCCLCGREFRSLTSRHLAMHEISVKDYKVLCGFDPDQALMSNNQYQRMRKNIEKALAAKNRVIK